MFTLHSRMALLAGLLTAALSMPALAVDVDALKAQPTAADELQVALASPPVHPGPMIARESLATETSTRLASVGGSQPARSTTNLRPLKPARAANAAAPQLILGVRF
jgi:hypothetical protein